jgi:hypothetical protein
VTGSAVRRQRGDIALMVIGLAGTALSLAGIFGMLAMTVISLAEGDSASASIGAWATGSLVAMAVAGLPAVALGLRGLLYDAPPQPLRPAPPAVLAGLGLLFPVALAAGAGMLTQEDLTLVALPVHLATAVLPVAFLVVLVQILGPRLTLRRLWSQFLTGLWGMPPVAILLEVLALIPVVLIVVAGLAASVDVAALLAPVLETGPDPGALDEHTAVSLLLNPWVLAALFGFIAGLVPLIEEAVKTLAVLPLARRFTPAEAFLGGALGGAGYGLFEALFLSQPDPSWLTTMIGRGGASVMHAFTAAITCWGISQVVHRRAWGRLALAYFASVFMHSLWNASVIATGLAQVNQEAGEIRLPPLLESLSLNAAPVVLAALSVMALVGLALGAHRLTRAAASLS